MAPEENFTERTGFEIGPHFSIFRALATRFAWIWRPIIAAADQPGSDPHDLNRFVDAQASDYARALEEIQAGRKRSHWMWYVFPQIDGLGFSSTTKRYAIKSLDEAKAYLEHPTLGPRLIEIAEAAVNVTGRSATEVFGSPDDMKLKSCATLFASVTLPDSVFARLLDRYFEGECDRKTIDTIGATG